MNYAIMWWLLVTFLLLITSPAVLKGGVVGQRWLNCFLVWLVISMGWIVTLIWSLLAC